MGKQIMNTDYPMEPVDNENLRQKCEEHERDILFYCLDPRCKKNPELCLLCLKNNHSNCKDEFIVPREDRHKVINLVKQDVDFDMITDQLNQKIELKLYELGKQLTERKENFMNSFNLNQDNPQNLFNTGMLANVKKNFNFEYDEETKKINISSKFNVEEEKLTESVTSFENLLEKKILNFLDDFSKLKFSIKGSLSVEDFIFHNALSLEDTPEGIYFKRKPENSQFNYFTALYTLPLETISTFKVNVEKVYVSDRYVDVGIVKKSKYDTIKSGNFINSFNSGGISYCGYSISGGLTGDSLTTTSSSPDGLGPGKHFYLTYTPGQEVRFYSDDNKINLKKYLSANPNEVYYLFCVVYHPQTEYLLQKIE